MPVVVDTTKAKKVIKQVIAKRANGFVLPSKDDDQRRNRSTGVDWITIKQGRGTRFI